MRNEIKDRIEKLAKDVGRFSQNDPLVNVDFSKQLYFENLEEFSKNLPDQAFKKLLNQAKNIEREKGIFPLCIASVFLTWEIRSNRCLTPIFLTPVSFTANKITKTIAFEQKSDESFINPFVLKTLEQEFSQSAEEIEAGCKDLIVYLSNLGFTISDERRIVLDNFHHHRFEMLRELEELAELEVTNNLASLLGDATRNRVEPLSLTDNNLFSCDSDQFAALETFKKENVVLQGPPGTGKSHVLINILGKILFDQKTAVVLSEKRVALEVLTRKLDQVGLENTYFITSSETVSKDIIRQLKKSWEMLEQAETKPYFRKEGLPSLYLNQLQFTLDVLNYPELIGGLSYAQFVSLAKPYDLNASDYNSALPDILEWLAVKEHTKRVYSSGLTNLIFPLSSGTLQSDTFQKLDQQIRNWLSDLENIAQNFELKNFGDLSKAMHKAALCQAFLSDHYRVYAPLMRSGTKANKNFVRLCKAYRKTIIELNAIREEDKDWKREPSDLLTQQLLEQNRSKNLFAQIFFSIKWKNISHLPVSIAEEQLQLHLQHLHFKRLLSQQLVEFSELNIPDPEDALRTLDHYSSYFNEEAYALKASLSDSELHLFADKNSLLNKLYHQIKTHFHFSEATDTIDYFNQFLAHFDILVSLHKDLSTLSSSILRNLGSYTSLEILEAAIFKSNQVRFLSKFPQFENFQEKDLFKQCDKIIEAEKDEQLFVVHSIRKAQREKFEHYHKILQTPSSKLNDQDKAFKKRLKTGKSILVKEFKKSKQHISSRMLFHSEARIWVQLLCPIWLSNPLYLAKSLPLEPDLFDCALFDESSQIPLYNALGGVYRSKNILVSGDQQQMGPTSFFQSGEVASEDLLQQAAYHWKNCHLKHHYRSEHPALIEFSNRYFYDNSLIAFPSYDQEKLPIEFHYCEDGTFVDRQNEPEAYRVADHLEKLLKSSQTIGLVAFSEAQLQCIFKKLSPESKQLLDERIEAETVFFKALENVQGEECDRLIVSLGYGKNEDGIFYHRFGHLNSTNGSKRLNVLLSRARQKIDFFASVKSEDFKISANPAIELLRKFMAKAEKNSEKEHPLQFPYALRPEVNNNVLTIEQVYADLENARELVTFYNTLILRGWKIEH